MPRSPGLRPSRLGTLRLPRWGGGGWLAGGLLGGAGMGLAFGHGAGLPWSESLERLGLWPGLGVAQGLLLGGAAWVLWRRGRRPRPGLAPQWQPRPGMAAWDGLRLLATAPGIWQGRRGAWSLELRCDGPAERPWRLQLRRGDRPAEVLPLGQGSRLADALAASRHLRAPSGQPLARPPVLDCDLEFALPHGSRLIALAEGGFALQDPMGLRGISAGAADILLQGGRVGA